MPGLGTIINVDDNEPARYAKGRLLSAAGFEVHSAATGTEGLRLVSGHDADLVLLDVNLPDVNGIEVCRRLKSTPKGASVIVLQISASALAAEQATTALNSGADAYLTEPVDPDVLIATIQALLRLRRAERALASANDRLLTLNHDLKRSNEDLERFASVASHDLQEPLRSMSNFASLLERSAVPRLTEREQEYLRYIVDGAQRMRALIDDLLLYSHAGQTPQHFVSVDVGQVLKWVLENLSESITESGAKIAADALPVVRGEEVQLGHVFQNLIGNAIKYRAPERRPVIRITAERNGDDEWIIRVRDNGIGIAPEYQEAIFAPFKRLHSREIPGTGIGLAVCRRVVESHGGRIWVESTPGQGSVFSFTLPAAVS